MKHASGLFIFVLAYFLGIAACTPKAAVAPEEKLDTSVVRLGVQPNEKGADLSGFGAELGKLTGLKVEFVVTQSYEELVEKFKSGVVDFAFFSPVNFIAAEKDAGAKVLLKKVYGKSEFYHGALIVLASSKIKDVAGLKGKKIAFVDPKSTSGYWYPLIMFKNAGFTVKDVQAEFSGTHDLAVKMLADGKVDAAAVWSDDPTTKSSAWEQYLEKNPGPSFRVLQLSDAIPNDAFAVRSKFYEENPNVAFRVMEGLISMSDQKQSLLKSVFNTDKMTTATSRHYDSVRILIEAQKEMQP